VCLVELVVGCSQAGAVRLVGVKESGDNTVGWGLSLNI
jgi:hypothetical protein